MTAEPPLPSAASPLTGTREDRPDRSTDRPSTPPTRDQTADKKAKEEAAKKAAAEKAAAEKAKKDAAKKKAEAQEKESGDDSEGAGSQKSDGDDAKKESDTGSEEKSGDSGSEKDAGDTYRAPTDWEVVGDRYVTTALNLRVQPSSDGEIVKVLPEGEKVEATSTKEGDYTLVIYSDDPRWLATEYLSKTKPEPREDDSDSSGSDEFSMEPCPSGSKMEEGLTEDGIRVHRAICHQFPSVKDYGGVRSAAYGYHGSGRAVDAMVDGDLGWEVARWVRANAKKLGVMEVIHAQKIWTVQRSSEGWRSMEDRGSATANHYDHVHVSVYGSSGTG
ncbi:SH3 domain-containing protein [Microlunatus speluncae]|uniref:SH3 domain-containing protein n=1 Tax=Microlunatus speluncae TaxID=2594267 RepID=UPI0012662F7A|nr:SH3 domain-containing protein [Microlunatus speluncae]